MKKLSFLLLLFGTLALTACGTDEDTNVSSYNEVRYSGTLTVTPLSGGEGYTWEKNQIGLVHERDGSLTLWLYETRFVPAMPAMNMSIPQVISVTTPGVISLQGDRIVPYMGQTPYEQYLITRLSGSVKGTQLDLAFDCIGYHVTFLGNESYR